MRDAFGNQGHGKTIYTIRQVIVQIIKRKRQKHNHQTEFSRIRQGFGFGISD